MRAAGARKIRKSVTRREKSGAGSAEWDTPVCSLVRHGHLVRHVPAGPAPCARWCMLVSRVRDRHGDRKCDGHACASVRRALARPKRKLVKVAPGYLRKRVKVASQRDRHKMVKVSEGAENIPPPYAEPLKTAKERKQIRGS